MKIKHDDVIWTIWEVTLDQVVKGSLTEEISFKLTPRQLVRARLCSRLQVGGGGGGGAVLVREESQ